jgi:hypothetical protein
MAQLLRRSITEFPRGHEFQPSSFAISESESKAYLDAVGDDADYGETVPPLAAVALGLQALQTEVELPDGSLHTGQEVEHQSELRVGQKLTMTARLAQRSERQGFVISVLEFEINAEAGSAIKARTTIMSPGGAP